MAEAASILPTEDEAIELDFPALAKSLRRFADSHDAFHEEWQNFNYLLSILESKLNVTEPFQQQLITREPRFEYSSALLGVEETKLKHRILKFVNAQALKRNAWVKRLKMETTKYAVLERFKVIELEIRREIKAWKGGSAGHHFNFWSAGFFEATRSYLREWKELQIKSLANEVKNQSSQSPANTEKTRQRIVDGLRLANEMRNSSSLKVIRLPWVLLPSDESGRTTILRHLDDYQRRNPHLKLQIERLNYAYQLVPSEVFVGRDEFDGYLAFTFGDSKNVLLEHPVEGNAAYVFTEDWRFLSRLTKSTLLQNYSGTVQRIIHRQDSCWREKLKSCLGVY